MTTPATVFTLLLCFLFSGLVTNWSRPVVQEVPPPIPRGSDEVDIRSAVLPDEITKQNFGQRIKDRFYAVEVVAGNPTSKSFLIESIGFKSGEITTPATSPRMLLAYIRDHDVKRFCESVFDGSLLLPQNHQVRTVVFVPKTRVANEKREKLSPQTMQERIGQIVVIMREVTGNPIVFSMQ